MSEDEREQDPSAAHGDGGDHHHHKGKVIRKARHLLRLPFTKSGKRGRRKPPPPPPPPPPDEGDLGKGCYLCFLPPRSPPDSAIGPQIAGGSKKPSYYEFLKSMIENNDFYSPECNVHRDIP